MLNVFNLAKMSRLKRNLLCAILPSIGCIMQLYYIITEYSRYSSVTEITKSNPERYQLPVLSFCVDAMISDQKWTFGTEVGRNELDFPTPKSLIDLFEDLNESTLNELLFDQPVKRTRKAESMKDLTSYKFYYEDSFVCFSVAWKHESDWAYNNLSGRGWILRTVTIKYWQFGRFIYLFLYAREKAPFFIGDESNSYLCQIQTKLHFAALMP